MASSDIAAAIGGARTYLTANPAEASYRDGAATAVIEDGLRVRVDGPDGATVATDMVKGIGGGGSAPSPSRSTSAEPSGRFVAPDGSDPIDSPVE